MRKDTMAATEKKMTIAERLAKQWDKQWGANGSFKQKEYNKFCADLDKARVSSRNGGTWEKVTCRDGSVLTLTSYRVLAGKD